MRTSAKRLSWRSFASLLVVLFLFAGWWFTLAPRAIGGPLSVVIVDGTSMQPKYHTGDVVILHRQSSYHLGEIAAVKVDGGQVIHQLVAGNAQDGWHTKGINRKTPDSWTIPNSHVLGTPWIFLPGAGRWTTWVKTAEGTGLVFGLLCFGAAALPSKRRRSVRRQTLGQAMKEAKRTARAAGDDVTTWVPRVPFRVEPGVLSTFVLIDIVGVVLATMWTFPKGRISLGTFRPDASVLIGVWSVIAVVALVSLVLAGRVYRGWGGDPVDKAVARFREVLVPVARIEPRGPLATVNFVGDLKRIATISVAPVLHHVDGDVHTFGVLTRDATYLLVLNSSHGPVPPSADGVVSSPEPATAGGRLPRPPRSRNVAVIDLTEHTDDVNYSAVKILTD